MGIVGAFARDVVIGEADAQHRVDGVEVALGLGHEALPDGEGFLVAALQCHHPEPCARGEAVVPGGGRVELGAGGLVEGAGVVHQQRCFRGILADLQPVLDQHAERGAPVADVVLPDHGVTQRLEDLHETVPHHRGAQVADVHFFRDIRGGIVDDDALDFRRRNARGAGRSGVEQLFDPGPVEGEIDEPWSGDLDGGADPVQVEGIDDPGGGVPRRHSDLLGQRHGGVDLDVRELRGPDHGIRPAVLFAERAGNCCLDSGDNHFGRIIHTVQIISSAPPPMPAPRSNAGSDIAGPGPQHGPDLTPRCCVVAAKAPQPPKP